MAVTPLKPHSCVVCAQPATRTWRDSDQAYCAPCSLYAAGQEHARALVARDQLQDAVGALLDCDVSGARIEALVRAFVDSDVPPPVEPKTARPGDPRPWAALLESITEEGS